MTTIELGDVSTARPAPAPPPVDHRRLGRWALVVLAVLSLVALGGSARPPRPLVHELWRTPVADIDGLGYSADTVYVSRTSGPGAEVSAYDLAGGRKRWTSTVSLLGPAYPQPYGGLVLLHADQTTANRQMIGGSVQSVFYSRSAIMLNAATGAELWRTTGDAGPVNGDTMLIEEHDDLGRSIRLREVRARDGSLVWSRPLPRDGQWVAIDRDGRPDRVVSIDERGAATVWRYSDGATVRTARLPGAVRSIAPAGDLLVVTFAVPGDGYDRDTTHLYRSDDLAMLWTVPPGEDGARDCGPVICTSGENGVVAHDPLTGATRWRNADPRGILPITPDRLLLQDGSEVQRSQLVNAHTGVPLGALIQGQVLWRTDPNGKLYVLRHVLSPTARVAITDLDLTTSRESIRGTIAPVLEISCWDLRPYVPCRQGNDLVVTVVG